MRRREQKSVPRGQRVPLVQQASGEQRERLPPWLASQQRLPIAQLRRHRLVPEWCCGLFPRRPPGWSWSEFFSP